MKQAGLAVFERASEVLACVLAAAVAAAYLIKADQMLLPEAKLETFEVQFANRWAVEAAPEDAHDAATNFLIQMGSALAQAW